jgi:LytS/YehU family sensor histidine kinase
LQIESVKQERKQIDLQLKALKSQLSPHFLFNSLNTISSLVFVDKKKAKLFIRRLSKLYDYTLQSYHSKLITLKEELDFVESYQYLLAIRFEDKFKTNIRIDEGLWSTKIPPLSLQMLVENAVKHNTMSIEKPLIIDVFIEGEYICVTNTITESPKEKTSFHVGLKNINKRYLLLVNKGISVSNGNNFSVKIPIIR